MLKMSSLRKVRVLGKGSYGRVYEVVDVNSNETFALKVSDNSEDGIHPCTLREIVFLKKFPHERIVKVHKIITSTKVVWILMEKAEGTVIDLLSRMTTLGESHIRHYARHALEGLVHIHSCGWIHRDIKPSNLLVYPNQELKIADFTASVQSVTNQRCENLTSTWYCPPDVLLGSKYQDTSLDIWSLGLTICTMFLGEPIIKGDSHEEVLRAISDVFGIPTEDEWPAFSSLPYIGPTPPSPRIGIGLVAKLPGASSELLDLLEQMLVQNPQRRITARDALAHEFFTR